MRLEHAIKLFVYTCITSYVLICNALRFDYNIEGHRYLMSLLAAKNTSVKLMDPWVKRCLDTIPGGHASP